jgi:hypothetical protein
MCVSFDIDELIEGHERQFSGKTRALIPASRAENRIHHWLERVEGSRVYNVYCTFGHMRFLTSL